ncbi:hypothetical protein ABEB36_010031 [Hypothenemus hampei]|uniref:Chibby n=1 Tax=Hypothenemus hampei TaxID=57062 RepID=A0ABD1EME3_HYPHA
MMPWFGNRFPQRKTPLRQSSGNVNSERIIDDLIGDNRSIKVCLSDQQLVFENGEWIPNSGRNSSTHRLNQKLKKKKEELEEENNLLRVKYELVLNMLAETVAAKEAQERELEKLKRSVKR